MNIKPQNDTDEEIEICADAWLFAGPSEGDPEPTACLPAARVITFLEGNNSFHALIARSLTDGANVFARDESGNLHRVGIVHPCGLGQKVFARVQFNKGILPVPADGVRDMSERGGPFVSDRLKLFGNGFKAENCDGPPIFGYLSAKNTKCRLSFGNGTHQTVTDVHIARVFALPPPVVTIKELVGLQATDSNDQLVGVIVAVNEAEKYAVIASFPNFDSVDCGVTELIKAASPDDMNDVAQGFRDKLSGLHQVQRLEGEDD